MPKHPLHECSKILTVKNKMGIHARPAAMIVRIANQYEDTDVQIVKDDAKVNAKSIMGVMMLAAGQDSKLIFHVRGKHAGDVLRDMEALFARQFQEVTAVI